MSKNAETLKTRPFPWKCAQCGQTTMMPEEIDYTTEIVHDGRPYKVTVPGLRVPRCQNPECRTILLNRDANRCITQAFRRMANLLEPEMIRRQREKLGLTQSALADLLEVGPATVSRWETGAQVQQRVLDKLLRLFFGLPEVRQALAPPGKGKFHSLRPTREMRQRAELFRPTASRRSILSAGAGESDHEPDEATAGNPAGS